MIGEIGVQDNHVSGVEARRIEDVIQAEAEMPSIVGEAEAVATGQPGISQVISLDAAQAV